MRKTPAILGMIICLAAGFGLGWGIPALISTLPGQTLVDKIQARGTFIVGTSSDWPPFEIYNITTSEYEGFDIDLADMIAAELGVTVTWSDMDFDSLIGACTAGTIDMIAAAMMVTADRAEVLAHSVPYIRVNQVVIVNGSSSLTITDLAELTDYQVGAQVGTTEYDELIDLGMTDGVNLTGYAKADVMIAALVSGAIEAAYVDEPVFTVWAKSESLKIIYTVPAEPTALWCRWEEPELMQVINKVILEAYADGSMDTLIAKWFE